MDDTIYLHIGLPKAASTYLQRQVFPELPVHYIHKSGSDSMMTFVKLLRAYYRDESVSIGKLIKSIPNEITGTLGVGANILVSDENLSISSMDLWERT